MSQNLSDFKTYHIKGSEIDEPLEEPDTLPTCTISAKKAENIEAQMKIASVKERRYFKKHGFKLIVCCLAAYGIIAVGDYIISNFIGWQVNTLLTNFVELLKFTISSLIGYVFAEITDKKED